jgi:hypothetical protein
MVGCRAIGNVVRWRSPGSLREKLASVPSVYEEVPVADSRMELKGAVRLGEIRISQLAA